MGTISFLWNKWHYTGVNVLHVPSCSTPMVPVAGTGKLMGIRLQVRIFHYRADEKCFLAHNHPVFGNDRR